MSDSVEIVKALVMEIKPDRNYLIGLNKYQTTQASAQELLKALSEQGFSNCTVMIFAGDPSTGMVALEQKSDGTTKPV